MASKLDKITRLAAGLADLPAPDASPFPQPASQKSRGRPPKETVSLNLRLPSELRERIALEAARRSAAARRTITTQAVIVELMDKAVPPLPDDAPMNGGPRG